MATDPTFPARAREFLTRPLPAAGALLVVYVIVAFAMDPGGYLGTDTGAKVYTLEVMDREGTASPDVGYWAEEWDPDGRLHPLYQTQARADGSWVAVTTLPILEAARPLYAIGGYRATLLLPMLGALAAAFGARAVSRRIGGSDEDGWLTFWVVGLASPVAIYALDFWEHSIGLAAMVWAVALLLDVLAGRGWWRGVLAGALFGSAAVLRNESFVYALVVIGTVCVVQLLRHRSVVRPAGTGLATIAGFAVPWFANVALERAVDAPSRAARTSGTASRVGDDTGERVREAFQTLFGLNAGSVAESVLLGAVVVAVVLAAFRAERRGDPRFVRIALLGVGLTYTIDAIGGLGFVSGLLLAFPLAIAGVRRMGAGFSTRLVGFMAVAALPVVYAFQYIGGGAPQWGGRYTLTSSILLGVVGLVGLLAAYPAVGRGLIALSAVVTLLGVAWLGERSRSSADFFDQVVEEAAPVVISRNGFLVREAGAAAVDRRWLSVNNEAKFRDAIDVAEAAGEERFSVLEYGGEAPPESSLPTDVDEIDRLLLDFVGIPVGLVTYRFEGDGA